MLLKATIEHKGVVLAQIYDLNVISGTSFPSPADFPLQFGVGSTPTGRVIPPHVHTNVERTLDTTAEFIFILEGTMNVVFLNADGVPAGTERLGPNMAFLQVQGGHQISFEPNTKYFEIKQGPYLGRDVDKRDVTISS